MADFRNQSTWPRGMRNNNPGNLRPFAMKYAKQVGVDNQGHAIFANIQDGVEYGVKDLLYKFFNRVPLLDTPRKFVAVYAPSSDGNDESAYRAIIKKFTGLDADSFITKNPTILKNYIRAVFTMEVGANYLAKIPSEDLENGIEKAFAAYNIQTGNSGGKAALFLLGLAVLVAATIAKKN